MITDNGFILQNMTKWLRTRPYSLLPVSCYFVVIVITRYVIKLMLHLTVMRTTLTINNPADLTHQHRQCI